MVPLELISDLQRAKEFLGPTSAIANKHGRNGANTAHDHNRDKKLGRKVVLETRSSLRFSRSSPRSRSREDASKKRAKASLYPLPLPATVINREGRGCYAPTPIVDWWISPSVHLLLADLNRNNHVLTGRDPEGANPDVAAKRPAALDVSFHEGRGPSIKYGLRPKPGHVEVEQRAMEVSWSTGTADLAQARGTL
jgi:hypothetical protein